MTQTHDRTEGYLWRLMDGNLPALLASFEGEPLLDDPLVGHVAGTPAFKFFVRERRKWLAAHSARLGVVRTTRSGSRAVFEGLLHLQLQDGPVELPVAVVGDQAATGRLHALRVYHSLWALFGQHRVRPPLLTVDHSLKLTGVIADYQHALAIGDVDAIVNTFEPDGYFREPAGGEHIFKGLERVREIMAQILAPGGITLEHCTVTDDGVACAIEFNAVKFGDQPLEPQAGVAVYERGAGGKLWGARVYDDVNVEALAPPASSAR
jgi:hypothetical protein